MHSLQSIASAFSYYHWYLLSPKWQEQENTRVYGLWRHFCWVRCGPLSWGREVQGSPFHRRSRQGSQMGLVPMQPWMSSVGTTREAPSWEQGGGLHIAFINTFIKLCQQRSILLARGYPRAILILFYCSLRPEREIKKREGRYSWGGRHHIRSLLV